MVDSPTFSWPGGQRAALSLSYDDALPCHHELVGPQLEAVGLRATFYATIASPLMSSPAAWRELASRGHELGNHTVFHPCRNERGEYSDWLDDWRNLCHYTQQRWRLEVDVANLVLSLLDGKAPGDRTYGPTCHHMSIGRPDAKVSLEPLVEQVFAASRGECTQRVIDPRSANLNNLGCIGGDRKSFDQLRREIELAIDAGGWLIYCMHGVGEGTHKHFVDAGEHAKLVEWLGKQQSRLWTAPVVEVARHVRQARGST